MLFPIQCILCGCLSDLVQFLVLEKVIPDNKSENHPIVIFSDTIYFLPGFFNLLIYILISKKEKNHSL